MFSKKSELNFFQKTPKTVLFPEPIFRSSLFESTLSLWYGGMGGGVIQMRNIVVLKANDQAPSKEKNFVTIFKNSSFFLSATQKFREFLEFFFFWLNIALTFL